MTTDTHRTTRPEPDAARTTATQGTPAPSPPPPSTPDATGRAVRAFFRIVGEAAARYTRLEYDGPQHLPPAPALVVVNHGFGGLFDLNVLVLAALADRLGPDRDTPITILTHQMAWTLGVGRLLEPAGFRPASSESARAGLDAGQYVLVMPGGDLDAGKPFRRRHEVIFGGRTGFARLAIDAGVPIAPVVITGAGESLLVLSDGQRLARALGLDKRLRNKTLPITVSIPWGLNVGMVGLLPYLPLPTKMRAAGLPPMTAEPGEDAASFAARVHQAMNDKAAELTRGRTPLIG